MKQFLLLLVLGLCAAAQLSTDSSLSASDPGATTKLTSANLAFASGNVLQDIHLEGTVLEQGIQGTFTYDVTSSGRSKLQLNLGDRTRTEVRSGYGEAPSCTLTDANGQTTTTATHNCLTSIPELIPLVAARPDQLALLYRSSSSGAITSIRKHSQDDAGTNATMQSLSEVSLTLDAKSNLPSKLDYVTHPDNDFGQVIPVEITYSDYGQINGVNLPASIKKSINGTTFLEFTVTSALFNTGTVAK